MSLRMYEDIHKHLWPMHNVMLLWVVMCLCVPLYLAVLSAAHPSWSIEGSSADDRLEQHYFYLNSLRVVWIWMQGCVFGFIELAGALRCTLRLQRVQEEARNLVYANPQHRLLISDVMHIPRPCQTSSLRLPATPCSLSVAVCTIVASAAPWFFVRFSQR